MTLWVCAMSWWTNSQLPETISMPERNLDGTEKRSYGNQAFWVAPKTLFALCIFVYKAGCTSEADISIATLWRWRLAIFKFNAVMQCVPPESLAWNLQVVLLSGFLFPENTSWRVVSASNSSTFPAVCCVSIRAVDMLQFESLVCFSPCPVSQHELS